MDVRTFDDRDMSAWLLLLDPFAWEGREAQVQRELRRQLDGRTDLTDTDFTAIERAVYSL